MLPWDLCLGWYFAVSLLVLISDEGRGLTDQINNLPIIKAKLLKEPKIASEYNWKIGKRSSNETGINN